MQPYIVDERGRLRPHAGKDGFPPGGRQIRSRYDLDTRFALRGNTRWSGYLLHVTETCDSDRPNVITDVATVPTRDTAAVAGIHTRLNKRCLLPAEHLLDGGYLSVALLDEADRTYGVTLIGPVKASGQWQHKEQTGFARDDFTIDFANRQVTCPRGQATKSWVVAPAQAPYIAARVRPRHCNPCPARSSCARGRAARTVSTSFPNNCTNSRRATAPTSSATPGAGSTPCAPESRAPSPSWPSATERASAVTTALPRLMFSTS